MKNDSITLSPNYGLNPTIPVCCWCGKPKNEVALMGHVKERHSDGKAVRGSDVQMPQYAVIDYNPCDKCEESWQNSGAVMFFEVSHKPKQPGMPPISTDTDGSNLYPTLRLVGISQQAAADILENPKVQPGMRILMDDIVFDKLFAKALELRGEPDVDADKNAQNAGIPE